MDNILLFGGQIERLQILFVYCARFWKIATAKKTTKYFNFYISNKQ